MTNYYLVVILGGMGVFLTGQAGMLIWHLSRMNTTLVFIRTDLERAMVDFERREAKRDAEVSTIFKRIDENRKEIQEIRARVETNA